MTELILYTIEDGNSQIRLRADGKTVWLTQVEMVELFDTSKQITSLRLKNIFHDGALEEGAIVKESLTVQTEGGRQIRLALPDQSILSTLCRELSWNHTGLSFTVDQRNSTHGTCEWSPDGPSPSRTRRKVRQGRSLCKPCE